MDRKHIITGVIVILLLLSIFQLVQLNRLSNQITGNVVAASVASSGKIDTTGWTADEKMNYEMHGIIPARAGGGSTSGSLQMVGGC
jgi:hypothetical protein